MKCKWQNELMIIDGWLKYNLIFWIQMISTPQNWTNISHSNIENKSRSKFQSKTNLQHHRDIENSTRATTGHDYYDELFSYWTQRLVKVKLMMKLEKLVIWLPCKKLQRYWNVISLWNIKCNIIVRQNHCKLIIVKFLNKTRGKKINHRLFATQNVSEFDLD